MVAPYRRRSNDSRDVESRVSSVETAVEHIEAGMVDIKESIRTAFSEVKHEIDEQQEYSKPKIVAWAGWAAVVLLVIGMFGSGYVRDLNRIEHEQNENGKILHKYIENDSAKHSSIVQRLNSIEREVFIKEVIVKEIQKDEQ